MSKVFKYLKSFIVPIVFIIGLLFLQANCDLSLPDYMSNIVNIGIQQGGIKDAVPEAVRESEFNKIVIFMDENDKEFIKSNYILLNKDNLSEKDYEKYKKDYPALSSSSIYRLNTKNKEDLAKINSIMGKPMLTVFGIENNLFGGEDKNSPFAGMKGNAQGGDKFKMLSQMPKEQLSAMKESINKKFDEMPETMITQSAVNYLKNEYKALGINTNKLQSNYILYSGAIMLLIALLSMAATVSVGYLGARVAAGLGRNLRKDVFKKVTAFSNAEFDKFSTSSLITRSTNDIQQIQLLIVMLLRTVFYAPIMGVGGILKVIKTDTSMAWIIGVAVGFILLLVIVMFLVAIPKFKIVQKLIDKLNLVTRESLTGMLVIRAFNTQKHEEEKFEGVNKELTKTNLFINRTMSMMMPIMMLIMNGITILIVWVGSKQVDIGNMQVGNMMAFIQYTMQIIMAFLMISVVSIMIPRASVSAQRIGEVLSTDFSIKDDKTPKKFSDDKKGYVEFKNVSFKYPGAEESVLENISFKAKPGETTAFIGSTGSGKSTLINLIPRFYDVSEGQILVDGMDVRQVTQHDLREKIGYVPQKGVLFSGTIESNLKYGYEEAKDEDLIKASQIAQAMEFIDAKKEKFNTPISQGGNNVSGGQKQRISIARALMKKPEIYIFDDSFSALDFKTDAALRKALKNETKESTVLMVAQRISTIMSAEQIIVLDDGKMVGKGTHKELLQNCEVYKQIALSQLSKEELSS